MTTAPAATRPRPTRGARRSGYVAAALVDAILLYLVNAWPGWDALPFLSEDFDRVVGVANVSMLLHGAVQLLYVARDPRWLRGLGDAATSVVAVVVMVRTWQVFPFTTGDDWSGWGLVVHLLLTVGVVGSAIAVLVGLTAFARGLISRPEDPLP